MLKKQTELKNYLRVITLSQYVKTSYFENKKSARELARGIAPSLDYKLATHKVDLVNDAGLSQLESNVAIKIKDEVLLI